MRLLTPAIVFLAFIGKILYNLAIKKESFEEQKDFIFFISFFSMIWILIIYLMFR